MLNNTVSNHINTQLPQTAAPQELFLSTLLVNYAEGNVDPKTITDALKTQMMATNVGAQTLSVPTTNGLFEVLSANASTIGALDALLFLATRPDFPHFLSHRATFGLITVALRVLPDLHDRREALKFHKFVSVLDAAIRRILAPEISTMLGAQEKTRLINAVKILPNDIKFDLSSSVPSLDALKRFCLGQPLLAELANKTANPTSAAPADLFKSLLEIPELTLAQKGVAQYRTVTAEETVTWKVENVQLVLAELQNTQHSPFRKGFLTEWYFDGLLRATLHNNAFTTILHETMKTVVDACGEDDAVLKGLLRALQRDLSLTAIELSVADGHNPQFSALLQRANHLHVLLLNVAPKNFEKFAKNFANWAIQMPVHPEGARLFHRTNWQWIRVLTTKQWEDDLRNMPQWLLPLTNRFAATIFSIAPNFWLQENAHFLFERLHQESVQPLFSAQQQHIDYVEYLCRTLRKKSPAFAARTELLLALRLIHRATSQEENQLALLETRYKVLAKTNDRSLVASEKQFWLGVFNSESCIERFGATPISRALHVLLYTTRLTAQAGSSSQH